MATWAEVQQAARGAYTLDRDDVDEFSVTVRLQGASGVRAQRVMARHYRAWGADMVEFRSAFREASTADPAQMLATSLQLPLGSICVHGRYLVLVHKCCLDYITAEGVLYLLTRVSLLADVLEEHDGTDRF